MTPPPRGPGRPKIYDAKETLPNIIITAGMEKRINRFRRSHRLTTSNAVRALLSYGLDAAERERQMRR